MFKYSNTSYTFFINLVNRVENYGKLYINFTNDWNFYYDNCTILGGVNAKSDGSEVSCRYIKNRYAWVIDNFEYLDSSKRIIVRMNVESPKHENQYGVTVTTYDTLHQAIIDTNNTDIFINITYGADIRFRAHPMNLPYNLRAGQCGALEFILFLKINMP